MNLTLAIRLNIAHRRRCAQLPPVLALECFDACATYLACV